MAVNGAVSCISTVNPVGSGFSFPNGVAVDRAGNVFVADEGNDAVKEVMTEGADFGSLPVATSTPATLSLVFTFDTGGMISAPAVLTQGAGVSDLDFVDARTGSCTTNGTSYNYNAGDSCTVDVTFTPKLSGIRYGAAMLISSGATIATGRAHGIGVGPHVILRELSTGGQSNR